MKTINDYNVNGQGWIRIEDLSVIFPDGHQALGGINLQFRQGEKAVLLGRSGAGKSTLLRCINHLQQPSSGRILIEGQAIDHSRSAMRWYRRQIAMVFQMHHLIGRLTALDNVLMGRLSYHGTLRSIFPFPRKDVVLALDCLDRVGLAHKSMNRADQLSGGERQRVGIARALVQGPKIILADEPVASLDPASSEAIMSLLCDIGREDNLTLLFSLHQIDLAKRFGQRIIGLNHGNIVFDASPDQLTAHDLDSIYHKTTSVQEPIRLSSPVNPLFLERRNQHVNTAV